jgi:hypothetical protein
MPSLTMSLIEEKRIELKDKFSWVNWSEIAREEIVKRIIFENYLKTKTLTDKEWAFCEKIDWHPVDELPIKEEFKKELEKRKKEKSVSIKSISDIFK